MSASNREYRTEKAWLRLVHTRGIGPKKAWKIYHELRDSGRKVSDIFKFDDPGCENLAGISPSLAGRLRESGAQAVEKRFDDLEEGSIRLLHPGSAAFSVPEIPGLPPTLAVWGDLGLLNVLDVEVLMKSRDTPEAVLKSFLQAIAQGKIATRSWCFCPFSRLDWELVESLLKLECGVILGLVSGISRRAMTLAHEIHAGRMAILAPEPPLRSRGAQFASIEAFYRLFSTFTRKIFLLRMRERGKTAKRVNWAVELGCKITEFAPSKHVSKASENSVVGKKADEARKAESTDPAVDDEDDRFISCL